MTAGTKGWPCREKRKDDLQKREGADEVQGKFKQTVLGHSAGQGSHSHTQVHTQNTNSLSGDENQSSRTSTTSAALAGGRLLHPKYTHINILYVYKQVSSLVTQKLIL